MKEINLVKNTREYVIKEMGYGYVGKGKIKYTTLKNAKRFKSREMANKRCKPGQIVLTLKSQLED